MLNELGEEAYVGNAKLTSPKLRTPKLTNELMVEHFKSGCTPVALYPEVVEGNPLGTAMIARWLLNKPGKLSKPIEIADDDLVFYHDTWCLPEGQTGDRLFVHTLNSSIFHNRDNPLDQQRSDACYYANKFFISGKDVLPEHKSLISLGQNIPRTPEEIAEILRSVEVLYCYEPSELISEARACGCPVIFVRSEYWKLEADDNHHNIPGTAIYGEPDALAKAKERFISTTVFEDRLIESSWRHVRALVERVYSESATPKATSTPNQLTGLRDYWEIPASERVRHTEIFASLLERGPYNQGDLQYQIFRQRKSMQEIDGQLFAERMMKWSHRPQFNVVIQAYSGEEALLADTLDTIGAQWYPDWHLIIVAEFAASSPELLDIPQITWVHAPPIEHVKLINEVLTQTPGDWLCLLEVGCTLESHALISFGDTINAIPSAKLIYCDEDKSAVNGLNTEPHFRFGFNLEYLRSSYCLGPCLIIDKQTVAEAGGITYLGIPGQYDIALKFSEFLPIDAFVHQANILLHTPTIGLRDMDPDAEQKVVRSHLDRLGVVAAISDGLGSGTQCIKYSVTGTPKVSIVIPSHEQPGYLLHCIESLLAETAYPNFELIIVLHKTNDPDALALIADLKNRQELVGRLSVLKNNLPFNYAALCNQGALAASGEYVIFLDNDTEFIQPTWLEILLGFAQREKVAAVSPRLSRPDGKFSIINQAPRVLGMAPLAGAMMGNSANLVTPGYFGNFQVSQEVSALSGSCLLVKKSIFDQFGGFDEVNTPVHEPVLELCLRLRQAGHKLIWTPWADIVHHNRITRNGISTDRLMATELEFGIAREQDWILGKYTKQISNDPYYHPNLSLQKPFEIEDQIIIKWDKQFHERPRILGTPMTAACGQYRMLAPFAVLNDKGLAHCSHIYPVSRNDLRIISPIELARAEPDTYLVQIAITDPQIYQLKRYREFNKGIFFAYSLDDIMGSLPKKHYNYNFQIREGKTRLRQSLALVDRLIVSTEPIADFCQGMIDDIVTIPNMLEGKRWLGHESKRGVDKKPRVGWAGAMQHLGDLELIKEVVEATADEVEWVFMGMCPAFLKPYVYEEHGFVDFDHYPAKLASLNLDLAIAPLEDNIFNEGKSNLRLLEYGIMGWPVVCSDVYPYRTNHAPVKRVKNNAKEWIEAIRERINNLEATYKEGDTLKEWVLKHYILEDHINEWLNSLTTR